MGNDPITESVRDQLKTAVETHSLPLSRYAYSLCGCIHRSRDAVQDTFLRLARRPEPVQPDERLAPWLFKVCRSRVIDHFRKEGKMSELSEIAEMTLPAEDSLQPNDATETTDSCAAVWQFIAKLPVNQREVIRLKFQNQMSYQEIADVTELSVSNVGYLLHTAMATLRQQLKTETDLLA
ncbi:MAG: sigma-70 family RNA polymerase sigma factor [Verrucomicrobiota bacterium]